MLVSELYWIPHHNAHSLKLWNYIEDCSNKNGISWHACKFSTRGGGVFGCSNTPFDWKRLLGVFKDPPFFLLACLSERLVMYQDSPTPCLGNWPSNFDEEKKSVGVPPSPPPPPPPPQSTCSGLARGITACWYIAMLKHMHLLKKIPGTPIYPVWQIQLYNHAADLRDWRGNIFTLYRHS